VTMLSMKPLLLMTLFLAMAAESAQAESCSGTRQFLLNDIEGTMSRPSQAYEDMFKRCMAAIAMPNVKDAFILADGGIAVIPKQDSIAATAATLSEFCNAYPRATLHFMTRSETQQINSIASAVKISSRSSTTCQTIKGGS
jgi:hypothetical protein